MQRVDDWQVRLQHLVNSRMHEPFAYGSNDCCTFAADVVVALTSVDPMADLRNTYTDEKQAARLLKVSSLEERCDALFVKHQYVKQARPGDIGVAMNDDREMLAMCGGLHWHAPAKEGFVVIDPSTVVRAWRVG